MGTGVKTRIVRIGNSHGIRIPKPLLEQVGLAGEVELKVQDNHLVVRAAHRPRQAWADQFQAMAQQDDDRLLDGEAPSLTQWDEDEWEW